MWVRVLLGYLSIRVIVMCVSIRVMVDIADKIMVGCL